MRNILLLLALLPLTLHASLSWKKNVIEYQAKPEDEEVTAVFHFLNDGDKPVKILQTKSSCGCTVVALDKEEYHPGEFGTIKAKFTFGERTGAQEKVISVYTDDPSRPIEYLKLLVDIPLVMRIEPQLLFWTRGEEPKAKTSIVTFLTEEPVSIVKLDYPKELFYVQQMEVEPGKTYTFTVVPIATTSSASGSLDITTSLGTTEKPRVGKIAMQIY